MEFNEFVPFAPYYYARLLDGTPYGLVMNRVREPVGIFVVIYGLEAFCKHCYIPDKNRWLTLDQIEHRRQELIVEGGRWEDDILIAKDNTWQLMILSLTKEQLKAIREQIANSEDFKFDVNDENTKTYISEEE